MHIVFATVEFITEKAGDGGLANYLAKASQIFADRGHRITIVVLSDQDGNISYYPNVEVVRVRMDEAIVSLVLHSIHHRDIKQIIEMCLHSYKLNQKIRRIHQKDKIDVVQYCHLDALGLFRNRKIPSIVRMSAFDPIDRETHKADFTLSGCQAVVNVSDKLNFSAIRRADGLFAPSKITARVLQKTINRECEVLETPTMKIDKNKLRDLPDNLQGKKYFLFFGTLNNKKGLRVIIQSIRRILKENPLYYFVMIGKDCGVSFYDGMRTPVVGRMKKEAGEYGERIVYFPAMFDRELLNSIIYHADFCILPYRFDNLPNTCVEAMQLGKIVISTYKSGISQLIKNGYNGFLVEQNNPEALIDKVREVIELPDNEKRSISSNAVKRTERMNPDNFCNYMMRYYRRVIDEHGEGNKRGKRK